MLISILIRGVAWVVFDSNGFQHNLLMTIYSLIFKVSPTGQRIVYERLQGYPMFYWHVNSGYIISPGQR